MNTKKAQRMVNQIISHVRKTGDSFLYFYGSKEDGKFIGGNHNMDTGDALLVIRKLVETFGIDRKALNDTMAVPMTDNSGNKIQ